MSDRRKAIAYIRTSTKQQVLSLTVQRNAIECWASLAGVDVVAWHTDHGVSGALPMGKRAGLSAAMDTIVDNENIRVLVTAHRDRLTRDPASAQEIYKQLSLCDVEYVAVDETLGGSAASKFRHQIDAAIARHRAEECVGEPPYGWRADASGRLVADDTEQAIIGHVRALRASGMTVRAIEAALQAAGVATQ